MLLLVTLAVVTVETSQFLSEVRIEVAAGADQIEPVLAEQLRSGKSLAQAAAFEAKHTPANLYINAIAPNTTVLYVHGPDMHSTGFAVGTSLMALSVEGHGYADLSRKFVFPAGVVWIGANPQALSGDITAALRQLLPFVLFALVIGFLLASMIARYATRPLREQQAALRNLADGQFAPIASNARAFTEIQELNSLYNSAATSLKLAMEERELAATSIRAFISDASHELKTPLTIIMGYVDAIAQGLVTERSDAERIMTKTLAECRRMRGTIEKLIALARLDRQDGDLGSFDPAALAGEIVESMTPMAPELHLDLSVPSDTLARGDAGELREAIVTVIDNAVKNRRDRRSTFA